MVSEENGQNLNCTLTFIKPKMNDSGLYTVKESVDESRDINFEWNPVLFSLYALVSFLGHLQLGQHFKVTIFRGHYMDFEN